MCLLAWNNCELFSKAADVKCLSEPNADFVTVSDVDLFAVLCLLCSNLSVTTRHLLGSNFFLENGLVMLWFNRRRSHSTAPVGLWQRNEGSRRDLS